MAAVPKATTLATASPTSRSFALIAGARAVMAVTPQMLVPAATRDPSFADSPNRSARSGTNVNPAPMEVTTTGMPAAPSLATSTNDSLAPTHTMPALRAVTVHAFKPGRSDSGSVTVLLIAMPSRMETGMPLTGDAPPDRP